MQLFSILLAIGLGVISLTFVLAPIFRYVPTMVVSETPKTSVANPVTEREQSARSALQEIELDYQLGNISEEDYNTLRERYVRRALIALKSRHDEEQGAVVVETYDDDKALDDLIEEQLRTLKEQENDARQ